MNLTIEQALAQEQEVPEFTKKDAMELLADNLLIMKWEFGKDQFQITKTSINKEYKRTYRISNFEAYVEDCAGVAIIVFGSKEDVYPDLAFSETSLEDITYDEEVGHEVFKVCIRLKSETIEIETV